MKNSEYVLGISVCVFLFIGGIIDYWQSARHHHKPIPKLLRNYFALFWLILYSGILPFILVFSASNFNLEIAKIYLGFLLVGMVLWDIVYSFLDKKTLISYQKDYWFWGDKDYPLGKNQIICWHLVRLVIGVLILLL